MRWASFLLFIFLLRTAIGGNIPEIACKEPVYNFGRMNNTESIEHTFVISNQGDAPLRIGKVRACCGATAAIATNIIAPGTSAALKVNLSLNDRKGELIKSLYITSNDPKQPYYQLKLQGTAIFTYMDVEPLMINFERELPDSVMETNVNIVCQSNFVLHITNVVSTVKSFTATCQASANNTHYCVTIKTVPPFTPGITRGNVYVFTDNKKYPKIDIPVMATVFSDLVVVPREILLSENSKKPEPVTRYVAIRSRSKKEFKILKVELPEPDIEVKLSPLDSDGYRCELKNILPFAELDGKHFVIITDHRDSKKITIPIRVVQ